MIFVSMEHMKRLKKKVIEHLLDVGFELEAEMFDRSK